MTDIFNNGKLLMLACDQGFEHGPEDFNLKNIDPQYIFDLAIKGRFTAIALQAGIAKHYYHGANRQIPLVVKLNGKTKYDSKDPVSTQNTTVEYAFKLGASAVGYTIYLGSNHEQLMFREFAKIVREAHEYGLTAICWMYPRGPHIKDDLSTETLAYGARIAHELGADVVKLKYNGDLEAMKWVVKCAAKTKVVFAGGSKVNEAEFLKLAQTMNETGAIGLAVGRNIFQSDRPLKMAKDLVRIYDLKL